MVKQSGTCQKVNIRPTKQKESEYFIDYYYVAEQI